MDNTLVGLSNSLTEMRDDTIQALNEKGFSMLAINAQNTMDRLINMINQTTGGGLMVKPAATVDLPPITNFMGEELTLKETVRQEDLSPKEFAKQEFANKVEGLERSFLDRTNEHILEAHPLTEQQIVIRGLAKRVGLEDFKSATITLEYLQQIREKIEDNRAATELKNDKEIKIAKDELQ